MIRHYYAHTHDGCGFRQAWYGRRCGRPADDPLHLKTPARHDPEARARGREKRLARMAAKRQRAA